VGSQQHLQRLAEHRRVEHFALEFDCPTQQCICLHRRLEDADVAGDLGGRWGVRHLAQVDVAGVNRLLAGEPQRSFLAGMTEHHARFVVAVQVQPAPDIVGLDEFVRHGGVADQHFHPPDHPLAGDARLEQDLIEEKLELLGPVLGGDVDAHRLGEIVDAEHHVPYRGIGHDLRGDLQRLGMLDDGLDGDAPVHPGQPRREIADFSGAVGFPGFRQHYHVDVIGEVAHHLNILVVFFGTEGVDANRHGDVVALEVRQFLAQQVAAQSFLAAAVFQIEQQCVGVGIAGVLLETQGGSLEVFVDAQGRRVLHRRVIKLDAGPKIPEYRGGYRHAGLPLDQGLRMRVN